MGRESARQHMKRTRRTLWIFSAFLYGEGKAKAVRRPRKEINNALYGENLRNDVLFPDILHRQISLALIPGPKT